MRVRAAKVEELVEEPTRKKYTVKLAHPTYCIEPCPACGFPEADGGYCEECGWSRPHPRSLLRPDGPTR